MPSLSEMRERAISSIVRVLDEFEPRRVYVPGTLGDAVETVDVPDREGYVYVRLLGETERTVRARNMGLPAVAGTDVWVELEGSPGDRVGYKVVPVDNADREFSGDVSVGDLVADTAVVGDGTNQLLISGTGVVTLEGTGKRVLALRPEINLDEIKKQAVPDQVQIGVFFGYSLPIWNSDHEELYMKQSVPGRWDGASDIVAHVTVGLSQAEDVGDNFKFQLSWNHVAIESDVVPLTSHDVTAEQAVLAGRTAQYNTYTLTFIIDYDIHGVGNEMQAHDVLAYRLRRQDATNPDVTGEIIVLDWHDHFVVDKMFTAP